jgi:hypothetical protein
MPEQRIVYIDWGLVVYFVDSEQYNVIPCTFPFLANNKHNIQFNIE